MVVMQSYRRLAYSGFLFSYVTCIGCGDITWPVASARYLAKQYVWCGSSLLVLLLLVSVLLGVRGV